MPSGAQHHTEADRLLTGYETRTLKLADSEDPHLFERIRAHTRLAQTVREHGAFDFAVQCREALTERTALTGDLVVALIDNVKVRHLGHAVDDDSDYRTCAYAPCQANRALIERAQTALRTATL